MIKRNNVFMHSAAILVLGMICAFAIASCGKIKAVGSGGSAQNSATIVPESALAVIAGMASHTENAVPTPEIESTKQPATPCHVTRSRARCSGGTMRLSYGNCSMPTSQRTSVTLRGSWLDAYGSPRSCRRAQTQPLGENEVLTRKTTGASIKMPNGLVATVSTSAHKTYNHLNISDAGVTIRNIGGSSRTVTIHGIHRVLQNDKGAPLADLSMTTPNAVHVSGSLESGTREISDGAVTTFSNSGYATSNSQFDHVRWEDPACCYPTSGTVTTMTRSSWSSGQDRLEFGSTCGQAMYTDSHNRSGTVQLSQCE